MDSVSNYSLWTMFFTMFVFGGMGGSVGYFRENIKIVDNIITFKYNFLLHLNYFVVGVAAAFIVPLFLSILSSDLFPKARSVNSNEFFVFIGFCLISSITSRYFIDGVTEAILRNIENRTEQTKLELKDANIHINELKNENNKIKNAIGLNLTHILNQIDDEPDTEKLLTIYKHVHEMTILFPENGRIWSVKAYIEKRLKKYQEALESIENALLCGESYDVIWHYNKACYQALNCNSVSEIIDTLKNLKNSADNYSIELIKNLRKDPDFARIIDNDDFSKFLLELGA